MSACGLDECDMYSGCMYSCGLAKNPKRIKAMKKYQIWSEGYSCTVDYSGASFICEEQGNTFAEACITAHSKGKFEGYGNFDPKALSLWGCHLFDNEADARKSFG
jgi:hypothetical protein